MSLGLIKKATYLLTYLLIDSKVETIKLYKIILPSKFLRSLVLHKTWIGRSAMQTTEVAMENILMKFDSIILTRSSMLINRSSIGDDVC